ncbi:protein SPO16 homolog [Lineus longissimus]|uniref:protein SPO16 homolog n=1 Tax=Lineus longissimus TaxID=88925 RepID=UPI00315CF450
MSEECNQPPKPNPDKWPVIVNSSLKDGEVVKMLSQHHKVRVAEKTIENTCIFPVSGVAFMIQVVHVSTPTWSPPEHAALRSDIIERLEKFLRIHRRCYLLLVADLHGPREFAVIMTTQQQFFNQQLNILPVHSLTESVHSMLKIAKVTCQPGSGKLKGWISSVLSQHVNEKNAILHALAQEPTSCV